MIEDVHQWLTSIGWKYTGETCGCNGQAKKRTYHSDKGKIIINKKLLTYSYAETINKPLTEIYTNPNI
jgi:hypothetical protein